MRAKSIAFEIKNVDLSALSFIVKSTQLGDIQNELALKLKDNPDFYGNAPTLIDLDQLSPEDAPKLDLKHLCEILKVHHLNPMFLKSKDCEIQSLGSSMGLADLEGFLSTPLAAAPVEIREVEVVREVIKEVVREAPALPTLPVAAHAATMVITKPLRSGQHVYAKGGDLIVLAMVNPGAEVMADGHIHVYAPLRGKAIAGAKGDTSARIFTSCLEAELLSIAGTYRTSDTPLPKDVQSQSAQISLEGEKLVMQRLG
jgi:septum site-determining protein MinC